AHTFLRPERALDPHLEHTLAGRDPIPRVEPHPLHPPLVDERPVRAPQVAALALRRIDLDQTMIPRQGRIPEHRTMHPPRSTHEEGRMAIEDKRAAAARAL